MNLKKIIWLLRGSPRCSVCRRPLNTKADRARGMGAGCWRKLKSQEVKQ